MSQLYQVLGVSRRASSESIKLAYRAKAKACHPDLHGGAPEAGQRFKAVAHAYETLMNADTRAAYDAELRRSRSSAISTFLGTFALTVGSGLFVATLLLHVA